MDLLEWGDKYYVNVEKMDAQHQRFVFLLSRLREAVRNGRGEAEVRPILKDLFAYAARHFEDEEDLLRAVGYPDIDVQRRQHQYFVTQLEAMREAYFETKRLPPESVLNFLADWFVHHILDEDKRYGNYIASNP